MDSEKLLGVSDIGALISDASEALGLFPSVIKSGEHWSDQCEEVSQKARVAISKLGELALRSASPTPENGLREALERRDRLIEALTPSGDTKAAYIGEVKDRILVLDENGDEIWIDHTITWDSTKAIMKMILARSALQHNTGERDDG